MIIAQFLINAYIINSYFRLISNFIRLKRIWKRLSSINFAAAHFRLRVPFVKLRTDLLLTKASTNTLAVILRIGALHFLQSDLRGQFYSFDDLTLIIVVH